MGWLQRKRLVVRLALLLLAVISICLGLLYAACEPQSLAGRTVFHALYRVTPMRPAFMRFYARVLRWGNAGYIPREVDAFLCARLVEAGPDECTAIMSFYVAEGAGRSRAYLGLASDATKIKAIGTIISGLDRLNLSAKMRAVVLVEQIRMDGKLYKPFLLGAISYGSGEQVALDSGRIDQAAAFYTVWWDTASTWQAKKQISPLENSGLIIASP